MVQNFEIKIINGQDPSSYFCFFPVEIPYPDKVVWDEIIGYDDVFSIEEGDVDCFLSYFLFKFFDKELIYNKNRFECGKYMNTGFEWYLTHNFFTYDTLRNMVTEILEVAKLLLSDFDHPSLTNIKEQYSIFYMCPQDCNDWIQGKQSSMRQHIGVVVDFYHRFSARLTTMMNNNPSTNILSIMGP